MEGNRVALYLRLSKEDGVEESQSIQSQREILTCYAQKQGWKIAKEYVDDGFSGTNFNRPSFLRLIDDITLNRVDILLTKDLSRLGRNYVQVGYYTEEFFPLHNVRYIALTDGFDSQRESGNEFMPFKNVINEWYARDTSKKIRAVLNNKAQKGEPRNTVFPIFGYRYNAAFERIPDCETAPIVQLIFKTFIELGSTKKTVEYLMRNRIKTPRYYNAVKYGYNKDKVLSQGETSFYRWSTSTVRDILSREEYLGVYKTAQTQSVSYKNKTRKKNTNAFVFENRYEPLIDRRTWAVVRQMLQSSNGSSVSVVENVFRGIVYCSDCRKGMRLERRKKRGRTDYEYRYYCNNKDCPNSNTISKKMLEGALKNEIVALKAYILSNGDLLQASIVGGLRDLKVITGVEEEIERVKERGKEIDGYIQKLFEHEVQGFIPSSTFKMMVEKYKREKNAIEAQLNDLTALKIECRQSENGTKKGEDVSRFAQELNETEWLSACITYRLLKRVFIKTIPINHSLKNREIEIEIFYGAEDGGYLQFLKDKL